MGHTDIVLTIGKLANACAVSVDTIRYYERVGLLAPAERSASGYRKYTAASISRLHFIRRAQSLGFTLEEVRELLELSELPEVDCADIREKAAEKIAEVEQRISDLVAIKQSLEELSEYCPGKGRPLAECSIFRHFCEEKE